MDTDLKRGVGFHLKSKRRPRNEDAARFDGGITLRQPARLRIQELSQQG